MPTIDVDPRFVDFYFPASVQYSKGYLGPGHTNLMAYADEIDLIPSSDWPKHISAADDSKATLDYLVTYILNQKSWPACVGNATCKAVEIICAIQAGLDELVPLSAMSLYQRIGNATSGAMVMDAIDELSSRGILPLDTPANKARFKHTHSASDYREPLPAGWEETGKLFRATEWYAINSFEELVTALLNGHPVVVGRQGHSILYVRVLLKNGKLSFLYPNSWGIDWGMPAGNLSGGFGVDSETLGRQAANGAFALRSVVVLGSN